jgi:hypothetical protein
MARIADGVHMTALRTYARANPGALSFGSAKGLIAAALMNDERTPSIGVQAAVNDMTPAEVTAANTVASAIQVTLESFPDLPAPT